MEKMNFGGANIILEDENLKVSEFENIISLINGLAKAKGFIVRQHQVSGNFSPFGPSGQYPHFQVGKGRGSKRVEFKIEVEKQQYSKNRRYCSIKSGTLYGPKTKMTINNENELLLALKSLYFHLQSY